MLTLTPAIRARIEAHAVEAYPHEACGVIVGRATAGAREGVSAHRTGNLNVERAHDRFTLDPKDYMRIDREARAQGLDIIGIYHSHPDHPAQPSETDRQQAWEGYSYVIVSVKAGKVADFLSFELRGEQFAPEEVRCLT
jgi:proteasome lid subunit RPN8/RPN11